MVIGLFLAVWLKRGAIYDFYHHGHKSGKIEIAYQFEFIIKKSERFCF